ncbi:general stress protein [Sediminivirga luteola]|uniref:General stress protein 17M-like domain-containing protein n=1 Tax=Sediminivirga luteola TaxID=1774748 RepID=A0A8J2TWC9_9MICO|nr:general stress protein [Sediminivirga luteola]MCI2265690.1 hypothetical protein [Sediminivirga luteola]GGA07405.1 hypothetical protein GCM10011333_07600 [Sediminivirga luteola]
MSSPFASRPSRDQIPHGEVIGRYRNHTAATEAVQYLASKDFEVSKLTIVGTDLRLVEPVYGILTWARAALRGSIGGAWLGMIVVLVLSLVGGGAFDTGMLVAGLLLGTGLGMAWGVAAKALFRRRGQLMSQPQIIASGFEVICPPDLVPQAQSLLQNRPD